MKFFLEGVGRAGRNISIHISIVMLIVLLRLAKILVGEKVSQRSSDDLSGAPSLPPIEESQFISVIVLFNMSFNSNSL